MQTHKHIYYKILLALRRKGMYVLADFTSQSQKREQETHMETYIRLCFNDGYWISTMQNRTSSIVSTGS